jgi:hypothetical protein
MHVALADDLQPDLQCRGPGGQLACGVSGAGPGQPDPGAAAGQVPQQRPGAVAVLDAGRGDHHGQQQPGGIDGDVPLAAVDLMAEFCNPAGSAGPCGHPVAAGWHGAWSVAARGRGLARGNVR